MKPEEYKKKVKLWTIICSGTAFFCFLIIIWALLFQKPNLIEQAELTGKRIILSVDEKKAKNVDLDFVEEGEIKKEEKKPQDNKVQFEHAVTGSQKIDIPTEEPVTKPADSVTPIIPKEPEKIKPQLAIIIGGIGLSQSTTDQAFRLSPLVTLGFSPYAPNLKELAKIAIDKGHELLVNLPMEPNNYPIDDPGPYGLISDLSDEENLLRLDYVLSKTDFLVGLYTNKGEKFSFSESSVTPILDKLKSSNILLVYGNGPSNASFDQLTQKLGTDTIISDFIIDEEISLNAIATKLAELEEIALKKGVAVGIGNPYPVTMKMIEAWIPNLEKKGISLVSITTIRELKKKSN